MTLVPNETEQALNRQYDAYAAAREEYRKKIAELAAENEKLRAALEGVLKAGVYNDACECACECMSCEMARAALSGDRHE